MRAIAELRGGVPWEGNRSASDLLPPSCRLYTAQARSKQISPPFHLTLTSLRILPIPSQA